MLFLCTVLLSCAFIAPKNAGAATNNAKDLGELTLNDGDLDGDNKTFNSETLYKLYDAILGTGQNSTGNQYTGTYNKIYRQLKPTNGDPTVQTWSGFTTSADVPLGIDSATLRSRNNNQNLYVKIAGIKFEVVYVTLDNNDNVIVDLWQAESDVTSHWSSSGIGFSMWYSKDNTNHPSNVYGNSYIRTNTLGQGGTWDEFTALNQVTPTPQSVAAGNAIGTYADLWNNMTTGNLSKFIVSPKDVKYQEVESVPYQAGMAGPTNVSSMGIDDFWMFSLGGDAYGTPVSENYFDFIRGSGNWNVQGTGSHQYPVNTGYGGNGTNYITGHDAWKEDKLWLPSLAETGHGGAAGATTPNHPLTGIWKLDADQRKNTGNGEVVLNYDSEDVTYTWLRSSNSSAHDGSFCLTALDNTDSPWSSAALAVRPAFHLNLTAASKSAASGTGLDAKAANFTAVNIPQDMTFTYTGETYTSLAKIVEWVAGGDDNLDPVTKNDSRLKDTIKGNTAWYDEIHHKLYYTSDSDKSMCDADKFLHSKAGSSDPAASVMFKIDYTQGSTDATGSSTSGKTAKTLEKFQIRDAGVYTITCKLETDSGTTYKWRDPSTGTYDTDATKTFKIIVKQKKVPYEWKSLNSELNEADTDADKRWKTTFALDFIPADGATANTSKAPWPYLSYTLIENTTKGILDNTNAKQNQTYAWDNTDSKHIVKVSNQENDTLPCIVLKFTNPTENYDKAIEHIYACNEPSAKGEKYPQQAGNYLVEAQDVNSKTSNYELVAKDSTIASPMQRTYEIQKMEIDTPALRDPMEYSGDWVEFEIAVFNSKVGTGTSAKWYHEFVQYGNYNSDGEFVEFLMPTDGDGNDLGLKHELSGTNLNKLVFKAHEADEYTIYYRLQTTTVENTTTYPKPVVRNFKWKCTTPSTVKDEEGKNVDGKSIDLKRVYEIAPKTLEFNFNSLKKDNDGKFVNANTWDIKANDETSKLTYSFVAGKEPVVIRTLSADGTTWEADPDGKKETPVLELWYYVTTAGETAAKKPTLQEGDKTDEFIFFYIKDSNNKHTSGDYTIMIKLAAIDVDNSDTLFNKNYRVKVTPERYDGESETDYQSRVNDAWKTYRQAMKLKPGEASLDDIAIKYQSEIMKDNGDLPADLPYADPGVVGSKNLAYDWNTDTNLPLQYFFTADFENIDFLELDTTYGNGGYIFSYIDSSGTETTLGNGEGFAKASKVRVKFKVQVKTDERTNNKMPKTSEYKGVTEGGKYTYTAGTPDSNGNIYDGILEFEYEIVKATVSEDALKNLALQYQFTGDTTWTAYDPNNPPEYNDGLTVTFRPNLAKLPQGVTNAVVANTLGDFKNPGKPTIVINVTVDQNYEAVNNYNLNPEISAKVIDISAELWKVENLKDAVGENVKDSQGAPYQITKLNPEKMPSTSYAEYISYEYWTMKPDGSGGFMPDVKIGVDQEAIDRLIDPLGAYRASSTNAYPVFIRPVLNSSTPATNTGVAKLVLKDKSGNSVKDNSGNDGYIAFNFGESKDLIIVNMLITSSVYGDSVNNDGIFSITYENGTTFQTAHYTIKVTDSNNNDLGLLSSFDFSNADAGEYTLTIEFTNPSMAEDFVFTESGGRFTVEKKAIALPTIGEMTFTGEVLNLADFLGGSYEQYKSIITINGDRDARGVGPSGYTAYLIINDPNYKWADSTVSTIAFVLTDGTAEITKSDDSTAQCSWNIAPLVLDTESMWASGGNEASLRLPETVKSLVENGTLGVTYRYYDDAGNEIDTLEKGKTYRVEAVLSGDDAGNVLFKTTSGSTSSTGTVSDKKMHTVPTPPKSAAAVFFGNALKFLKAHWLWFVIALAILLFLIILICIIAHRRKTKEAREEKKAKKEEEKERREEEKRRREEEREAERRKREQELELQKAKQEAELAKMKAELGLGAGAAGMAMAAQQQQPVQQPVQQIPVQQPVQQYVTQQPFDSNAAMFAKIEAELAQLRADQRAQGYAQPPMYAPHGYGPQPGYGGYGDPVMMAKMESEFVKMQAKQEASQEVSAAKMELEFMKMRGGYAPQYQPSLPAPAQQQMPVPQADGKFSAEQLGAIMASMMKNMKSEKPADEMPVIEAETAVTSVNTPTVYPPDAVITTTTTVDTTKTKPEPAAPRSDDGRVFDLDGFYDTFDSNK